MSLHLALGLASAVAAAIPASDWVHSSDRMGGAGIAATPEGVVYFVDRGRDVVWRLDDGRLEAVLRGRHVRQLQLAADGSLIGIARGVQGPEAWVVRTDGGIGMLARGGSGQGLAVDGQGRLYGWTREGREAVHLWRASGSGRFELGGGPSGHRDGAGREARFFPIGAMTPAADGSMLVTSGATVRRVLQDGRVETVAANEKWLQSRGSFLQRLLGVVRGHLAAIATDSSGVIYVANAGRELVAKVVRGRATPIYESPRGWRPVGVTVQRDRIYVLEYGAGVRIQVLDRRGGKATSLVEIPAA